MTFAVSYYINPIILLATLYPINPRLLTPGRRLEFRHSSAHCTIYILPKNLTRTRPFLFRIVAQQPTQSACHIHNQISAVKKVKTYPLTYPSKSLVMHNAGLASSSALAMNSQSRCGANRNVVSLINGKAAGSSTAVYLRLWRNWTSVGVNTGSWKTTSMIVWFSAA